ncbi:MAG: hypothetical protein IKW57_03580 [Alphaproteobacteria bacterium]|nr:hypothetical protein [Alphaproteobacteria bacterium]
MDKRNLFVVATEKVKKIQDDVDKVFDTEPDLRVIVQRRVEKLAGRFEQWCGQIEKLPEYDNFIKRVRGLANEMAVERVLLQSGRDF